LTSMNYLKRVENNNLKESQWVTKENR
jgi:hypothetical protein